MSTRTIAVDLVLENIHILLCLNHTKYKSQILAGIALTLVHTMSSTITCPDKSIASAELMTDPEKAAPDLEHVTPEPTGSTRAIYGIKASTRRMCSARLP
jgi:hypothetical protein